MANKTADTELVSVWDTPHKKLPRKWATRSKFIPAKHALFFPSAKMLCVKKAYDQNLITARTRCVFIERDFEIAMQLRKLIDYRVFGELRGTGVNLVTEPWLHVGPMASLHLEGLLGQSKLDYAFLDLCTVPTVPRAKWINTVLQPQLNEGASLAFTFTRSPRANKFYEAVRSFINSRDGHEEYNQAVRALKAAPLVVNMEQDDTHSGTAADNPDITRICLDSGWGSGSILPIFHVSSVYALVLLQGLLHNKKFRVTACCEYMTYQDSASGGTRMGMLRIDDIYTAKQPQSKLPAYPIVDRYFRENNGHPEQR